MSKSKYIFFHKQATSARMRFLVFENGSVLSGPPLPDLSVLQEDYEEDRDDEEVVELPSNGFAALLDELGVDKATANVEHANVGVLETPDAHLDVHAVKFTEIDPPFELVEKIGGKFIEMAQARQVSSIDMEVIRRVYTFEMGG